MKILMVIAKEGFRDEEFLVPYDYFNGKGIGVDVASTEKGDCYGKLGAVAEADMAFEDARPEEYFAVVLVGGPGSATLVGNKKLEKVLHMMKDLGMVVSAICYAPVILAKAGLLLGKKATAWNRDGKQAPVLKKAGAQFVDMDVVSDGLIVTANGPDAAQRFAEKVLETAECEKCWMK